MQHQGWFQDWLQGIVSRAATQQGFFAAIYEPVIVPSALINEANNTNGENSAIAKPTTAADQPSGLRGSVVIGNNSKNNNAANTSKGGEGDAKSQHEEITYSEEESDRVYVWGYFNLQSYYRPEVFKGLQGRAIVQVACGVDHTVFLTDLGKVYCSGQNTHYQLGDGTSMDHDNPTQVTKLDHINITKISCGSSFTVALTDTGNVVMWGTLRHGDKYGTVVLQEPAYVKPLKRVNIVDIASGGAHVLALDSGGNLYTWGNPMFGRLGRKTELNNELDPRLPSPVTSLQGIRVSQIDCGEQHSILLTSTGNVYTWGRNDYKECVGNTPLAELALPTLVELDKFAKPEEVQQVRAGFRFSMFRTAKKVFTWGSAFKPSNVRNAVPSPLSGYGMHEISPESTLPRDFNIVDMVTGTQHCVLLSERGQLFSFGLSTNGQTGQNSPEYVPLFTEIPMEKRIDKIAAGGKTSIAIHGSIRSVLGENMQKLINSEKLFGDVLLKPDSGQPIFAHKAVLAARSPVLYEMIREAEKSSNGTVPVLDFSKYTPKQLYAILIYIYTYRLLSSSLKGEELSHFAKSFKIKDPLSLRTPPPIILANDFSDLLVWKTHVATPSEEDPPLIVKNPSPSAGLWADVKFMVQGREIVAHKAVLCANSEYFRLMLTGGMKESQLEVLEVQDDITFDAFVATLQFLYTDNVEVDVNYALDILPVSSLYNLQRLKQKCEGIIEKQVEIDSVAYVWQVARFYSATRLESFCLDLLLPKFLDVQRTEAFKGLSTKEQEDLRMMYVKLPATGSKPK
jgi:E3 ubiquitin-protein ligase HERC4